MGGLAFSQILFVNAWFMFWNFLLEIPTGAVADFLGRKTSMIFGCITAIIGVLVYCSYPLLYVFLAAEIIYAVSFTLLSGADEALIYDSLKESNQTTGSKKILANMESFKLAGIVVAAVLGGFVAKYFGLRMTLLLQIVPITIALFISLTFIEPPVYEKKKAISFSVYRKTLSDGVRFFLGNKILKVLTLDMVIVNAFSWIIIWFYQALLMEAGIELSYFGIVHAFMTIFQIVVISNFFRLEGWLGSKRRLLVFSAVIAGLSFILLGVTGFAPLVILGIIVSAGFGLSRGPLFSNYMNKHIPSDKRATVLSTTSMFRTFSIVLVNISAGFLSDWSVSGTLLVLGILMIVFASLSKIKEEHLID